MAEPDPYLRFGEPPRDDVDAAAKLWMRYEDAGAVTEELGQMFAMSVDDRKGLVKRIDELRKERG